MLRRDGETAEDEIWTFSRRVSRQEAADMAQAIFADAYDMMNFAAHGEE